MTARAFVRTRILIEFCAWILPRLWGRGHDPKACQACGDKLYIVSRRDDGRLAVEACDACSYGILSDEGAAAIARKDGIECATAYPYVVRLP